MAYRELVEALELTSMNDAAFALLKLPLMLEDDGHQYDIRIKANALLERDIEHLFTRPVGPPSHKPKVFYHSFRY